MSDWGDSADEATTNTTTPAVATAKVPLKKAGKWEGEDEEGSGPVVSDAIRECGRSLIHSFGSC